MHDCAGPVAHTLQMLVAHAHGSMNVSNQTVSQSQACLLGFSKQSWIVYWREQSPPCH